MSVWIPANNDFIMDQEFPHPAWGMERMKKYSQGQFDRLENLAKINPQSVWNEISSEWAGNWPEGGDVNHKFLIIPEVIKFLNPQANDRILDLACGEGTLSRIIRETTDMVQGIDFSHMIDYAISREEKEPLGINYSKLSAYDVAKTFAKGSFNKIVCNMALMDMDDQIGRAHV